jgi:hypothetical protein
MSLRKRLAKLEKALLANTEPDAGTLFLWNLLRDEDEPDLPERPSDDFIAFFNGMTHEELLFGDWGEAA